MLSMAFINPKAGALNGFTSPAEIKDRFASYGLHPEITIGRNAADMAKFITKARRRKPSVVLIAGGDGTISTIAKSLINRGVIIGIIPTGSLNNIGSTIGLSGKINESLEVINKGKTAPFDAAKVGRTYILEGMGIGLIARIFDQTDWDKEKKIVQMAKTTVKEIVTASGVKVVANIDGRKMKFETVWLTVTNLGRIGALIIDPDSKPNDGKMELVYCKPLSVLELPIYTASFLRATHLEKDKFEVAKITSLTLRLPKDTVVHLDDSTQTMSRVQLTVVPEAFRVFVP